MAYNDLFLAYVALLSASLFAFVLAFASLRAATPLWHSPHLPRRGLAAFMLASGVITLGIWLVDPLGSLLAGRAPEHVGTYSTLFTHALDMAVIVPAALLAGVLVLRRQALGYLVAMSLLVLEAMLAPMMAAQTVFQLRAGITFSTAEVAGVLGGFGLLAVVALLFAASMLRAAGRAHHPTRGPRAW